MIPLSDLKLIVYFPAANAWGNMWTNYVPQTIQQDLEKIAGLGANAVRIIPHLAEVGYPEPSQQMLTRVRETISLAKQAGLAVELTLFDGFTAYTDVAGSMEWVTALLNEIDLTALCYADLQNEIDLAGPAALPWAQQLLPYVRGLLGGVPLTASVTANNGVGNLQTVLAGLGTVRPDFYDVHCYTQDGRVYQTLKQVQQLVAPAQVIVGETGYSTTLANSIVAGMSQSQASQEAYQDFYLRTVQHAGQQLGIPVCPWIYSDFTATAWPGANATQYGLFRVDGTAKPAVASEQAYLAGEPVSVDFNAGFEQTETIAGVPQPLLWRQYLPAGVTANFAADRTVAHYGTTSARISSTVGLAALYSTPIVALDPTKTYTGAVYAKGLTVTGANYLSLAWFDATGAYMSQTATHNVALGTSDWALLSVSVQPPANAAFVELWLKSSGNTGTVWFDDVSFGVPTT